MLTFCLLSAFFILSEKSPHIALIRPIDRSAAICTDLSDLFEINDEVEISVQKLLKIATAIINKKQ